MKMKFVTSSFLLLLASPIIVNNYQKWSDHHVVANNDTDNEKIEQAISELRKAVESKILAINTLLSVSMYAGVMGIFYDIVTKVAVYNDVSNPSQDLQWMRDQITEMKAKFAIHSANGDHHQTLQTYFNKKAILDQLFHDLKEAKEGLEDTNKENQEKFSSKLFLKRIVGRYDLIMREFQELNIQAVINAHVFSWEVFCKYKEIETFIIGDNKNIFHQYVGEFLDKLNEKFSDLVDKLNKFDHSKIDSEASFEQLQSLYDKLSEYREDIMYLITEDFKQEFPTIFMQLEAFSVQAKSFIKDLDEKMIKSFTDHFNEWNKTFSEQKAKISEEGAWEKVETLYTTFTTSHAHYQKFKKENNNLKLNYASADFALRTVINTINTIEYKGIDKVVVEDSNNPDYVTYYMADDTYAAWKSKQNLKRRASIYVVVPVLIEYPVQKWVYQPIAKYVAENGRILSWTRFKYFPTWAPKWLGKFAGAVGNAVVSGIITIAVDAIFGNLVDDIINKQWISEGAGISFKVNTKWMWVGAYLADSFHKTAQAQEIKYLNKLEI